MGVIKLVFDLQPLKGKLGIFKTGYTVSMVINYVKKMTMTCLIMIRHVFDTSFVVSSDKGW